MNNLTKEICSHCRKNVGLGIPHFECSICNRILHAKCFNPSNAIALDEKFYCFDCKLLIPVKYNPFKHMTDPENDNYDPCIQKISDTLETCTAYTLKDLNTHITPHMQNNLSAIFQNIDGNKTNFDAFSLELERVSEKFHIIGLAETNVDVLESTVYQLEGYNCFYQNKHVSKIKGSGVALYVKENLNTVVSDELSWVTKNLETLFITVQHDEPLHIGVLYRPPSGDSTEALNELRKIIEMCPKKNVYILGDFNINLHDKSSSLVDDFENIIFGLGLAPLISISTHEKRQFPWRNYSAADSAWVRLGPSRSAADAGGVRQIQFRRGTKNSAAESAADSADCRGTNLFRRGSDRIRGGLAELPPAECTEKGPRESATRIFRECPPRTFEKFRLRGTIPRLTTVPRNHSAANNRVAEPFRGLQLCRGLIPPTLQNELRTAVTAYNNQFELCRHPMPLPGCAADPLAFYVSLRSDRAWGPQARCLR